MSALKLERDALEKQYGEALAAQKNTGGGIPQQQQQQLAPQQVSQANATDAAGVDRIMELSKARDELREQNKQLKRAIARFFTLQRRLQQSMEDLDVRRMSMASCSLVATLTLSFSFFSCSL